jgi:hypothetical protein
MVLTLRTVKVGNPHTFGKVVVSSQSDASIEFLFICRWFLSEKKSGVNLWVYSLSKSLNKLGIRVGIICQGVPSSKNLQIDGIRIFPIVPVNFALKKTSLLTDWTTSSARYANFLIRQNKEIKGVFAPLSSVECAALIHIRGVPTYSLLVTDYVLSGIFSKIKTTRRKSELISLEKRSLSFASRCIGDSNSIVRDLSKALTMPELSQKTQVISIAVLEKKYSKEAISEKEKVVTFVGRIDYRKNLNHVLETWKSLSALEPNFDWKLNIIANPGEDKETEERLQNLTGTLGVTWIKNADDHQRDRILATSRILLVPSEYESFGIVAVEAMQFGNAIVANRVGGLKDIIPNEAGVLIDDLVPSVWAKILHRLTTNEEQLLRMNESAYMYGQKFGLEEQTERLRKFLGLN